MKILLFCSLLAVPGLARAQGAAPAPKADSAKPKTVLLAPAAAAPAGRAQAGAAAVPPPLPNPRVSTEAKIEGGRVTGGKTSVRLGKK